MQRINVRALQVFETLSRHLCVSEAANELGVTASAVSHQMRALTDEYGEELIRKRGRGIELTEKGQELARHLQDSFRNMDFAIRRLTNIQNKNVSIAASSSFAMAILSKVVHDAWFLEKGVHFDLRMDANDPRLTSGSADLFITADTVPRGYWSRTICYERLISVCSPAMYMEHASGSRVPFVSTNWDGASDIYWESFFRGECPLSSCAKDRIFILSSHFILSLQAALSSVGISLLPTFLAAEYLEKGLLVLTNPKAIESGREYKICCRYSVRNSLPLPNLIRRISSLIGESEEIVDRLRNSIKSEL